MSPPPDEIMRLATADTSSRAIIEWAGVFWILAESAILLLIVYCRRIMPASPGKSRSSWSAYASASIAGALSLAAVCLALRGNCPVVDFLNQWDGALPASLYTYRVAEVQNHLLVWSAFVLVWVLLESLIVFEGWRLYRQLIAYVQN